MFYLRGSLTVNILVRNVVTVVVGSVAYLSCR